MREEGRGKEGGEGRDSTEVGSLRVARAVSHSKWQEVRDLKVNQERCASRHRALDALLGQKVRQHQERADRVSQSKRKVLQSEALLTERLTSGSNF